MAKMTPSVQMTPVQTKLDCSAPECKKSFVSQKNMEKHKEKCHQLVSALSQSPLATSVRTLFRGENVDDTPLPSTQGGSDGSVNSPKVITEGTFQCNECPEEYSRKNDLENHKIKKHNKAQAATTNDNFLPDDQDLIDVAEDKEMQDAANEEEANVAEVMNMMTVDKIVDSLVEIAFKEMNPTEAASKPPCHECECKDENLLKFDKILEEKNSKLEEKSATIGGLMETL